MRGKRIILMLCIVVLVSMAVGSAQPSPVSAKANSDAHLDMGAYFEHFSLLWRSEALIMSEGLHADPNFPIPVAGPTLISTGTISVPSRWHANKTTAADRLAKAEQHMATLRDIWQRNPQHPSGVQAGIIFAYALAEYGRYNEAAAVLHDVIDGVDDESTIQIKAWLVLARLYLDLGNRAEAVQVLLRARPHDTTGIVVAGSNWLYETKTEGVVTGRLTLNGEPLTGVHVYATPVDDSGYPVRGAAGPRAISHTMTTESGHYWLHNVPKGTYQVSFSFAANADIDGAFVHWEPRGLVTVAEGETAHVSLRLESPPVITRAAVVSSDNGPVLEVEWEPHAGVDDYGLRAMIYEGNTGGGSTLTDWLSYRVTDTLAHVPMDRVHKRQLGVFLTDGRLLKFQQLFSVWAPTVELRVSFQPLPPGDGAPLGSRMQVSFASGPSDVTAHVDPAGYEFTPADRLFLQRKYEQAIAAYEKALQTDSADVHSLTMLAYIRIHGVDTSGKHKDVQKAVGYVDRLAELGVALE